VPPEAGGDGHARLGRIVVLDGCGSTLTTTADWLACIAVGMLVDVLEDELDDIAKIEITNGFA